MLSRGMALNPAALMRVGMCSLVAGSLSLRFATRVPGVTPDRADLVTGFLYGVAIATLLLSVSLRRRSRPGA